MRKTMNKTMRKMKETLAGVVAASAFAACAVEIPLDEAHWNDGNPLGGEFVEGRYDCTFSGAQWNVKAKGLPVSSNITVSATFTPAGTDGDDYKTAAIALYEAPRRFWHLALLETPSGQRTFELTEMRDGLWVANQPRDLVAQETKGGWTSNETYRLTLTMGPKGVEGVVTRLDGTRLYLRRYRHHGRSVGCGSPAIKGYGVRGSYGGVSATWQGEVAAASGSLAGAAKGDKPDARPFWSLAQDGEGRWNFVSPDGKADFLAGCSSLSFAGDHNFQLGYAPYGRAVRRKFGTPEKWAKSCAERLRKWGFSYATAGSEFVMNTDFSYSRIIALGQSMASCDGELCILACDGGPCTAFPNVFSPRWERYCRYRAKAVCEPAKDDRRLVGWFIDNELAWWGDRRQFRTPPARGLYDASLALPKGHSARAAAERLARERGFADAAAADLETRRAFVALCAERYFAIAARAIREADPNHLILGCRFAGIKSCDPVVWEACGRHCDALSVNLYPVADLEREAIYNGSSPSAPLAETLLSEVHARCGKPLMITEWSFSALDSGLPCLHGAGQRFLTQRERAKAVSLFAKTMYGLPYMAGYLFFKWCDQPVCGRKGPRSENTNYGLVNAHDEPWPEVTAALAEIQTNGAYWRRQAPPRGRKAEPPRPDAVTRRTCREGAAVPRVTQREDGAIAVENGCLTLVAKKGAKGLAVGEGATYAASLRFQMGRYPTWDAAREIDEVSARVEGGVATLDIAFKGVTRGFPFRIFERVSLPAGRAFFIAEHRGVENLSNKPLTFDQMFFRLLPRDVTNVKAGGDGFLAPPKDGQPTPIPPTLWRDWQSGVWLAQETFCGVATPRGSGVKVNYWKDANIHTDAVYLTEKRVTLAPRGRYAPAADRPFVIGAAGAGGFAAWCGIFAEIRKDAAR